MVYVNQSDSIREPWVVPLAFEQTIKQEPIISLTIVFPWFWLRKTRRCWWEWGRHRSWEIATYFSCRQMMPSAERESLYHRFLIKVWDATTGKCIHTLVGHTGEISSTQFDFTGDYCVTGSIDRTCKLWDTNSGECIETLQGHSDEVLDVCFNAVGNRLASASADATCRIYNVLTGTCLAILLGHKSWDVRAPNFIFAPKYRFLASLDHSLFSSQNFFFVIFVF